jgi:hypothetical protein
MSVDELWAAEAEWKTHVAERRSAERGMLACSEELQHAREHATRAVTAIGRREYDSAVEQLTESIRLCPRSDGLLRLRAKANLRAGKLPDALHDSQSASRLVPSSADNMLLLGTLCICGGALVDAGHALTRAMRIEGPIDRRGATVYSSVLTKIRSGRPFWQAQTRRLVPRIFDSRVELSEPERDKVAHLQLRPPAEPPAPVLEQLAFDTIKLRWELPDDDGGDEIFELRVECSWYDVAWSDEMQGLFDGMREFEPWHIGAAKTLDATFGELMADNVYCFRVRCANSIGESGYSPVLTVRTPPPATPAREADEAPPEWLQSDFADVIREQMEARGVSGEQVLAELGAVLNEHAAEIHVAFKLFCVLGSKEVTDVRQMQRPQFNKLVKDAGLLDGKVLGMQQVDLVFQRANMDFRGGTAKEKDLTADGGARSAQATACLCRAPCGLSLRSSTRRVVPPSARARARLQPARA